MIKLFARFIAAIRFLTLFPVPGKLGHESSELAGSIPFFPVVGLGLGVIAAAAAWVLWIVLPSQVAAVLLTVILLGFSGGLHLDGLADTADGFFSARSRTRILEIMRDSRIGAMGVIALVLALLLKVTALSSLPPGDALKAALLMPIAGRCSIVVLMALLPYARPEGGLGTLFYTRRSQQAGVWSFVFFCGCTYMLLAGNCLPVILFFMLVLCLFAVLCKKIIGGATGDTLGAACELSETGLVVALSALSYC